MPEINSLYQEDLAQQIRNGLTRIGTVCKNPLMITMIEDFANQLLIKFNEYEGNARLLANPNPKENVLL